MQSQSHSKPKVAEIHLVRGINTEGVDFFAYVAAYPDNAKALRVALRAGKQPDLKHYGVVLYLGRGEPDAQLSQHILNSFQAV